MTSSPQPMEVRRRTGSKRGDHGTYVAPNPATPAAPAETTPRQSDTSGAIGSDGAERGGSGRRRRVAQPVSEAQLAARAAYDAKPKFIVRGLDDDVYYALRAIYRHQLHSPDGIEGWSEFGRHLLRDYVDQYERQHGDMTGGEDVELPPGRRVGR